MGFRAYGKNKVSAYPAPFEKTALWSQSYKSEFQRIAVLMSSLSSGVSIDRNKGEKPINMCSRKPITLKRPHEKIK
jgi:hypothetical protein